MTGVALLGACGSTGSPTAVDTVVTTPTTTIDLLEGAFIHNESPTLDSDGVEGTTVLADEGDPSAPTTLADGAVSDTTTAGNATGDAADGGSGTTVSTAGGGAAGDAAGPDEGVVVISGVPYRFATEVCEIADDSAVVLGTGTTSGGGQFDASINYEQLDAGDGRTEPVIEITIIPAVPAGASADSVPDFLATNVSPSGAVTGDVTFVVAGSRISGSGTIVDFNSIAFPEGKPGPMTFEARCS